jgi:hypothetical protein
MITLPYRHPNGEIFEGLVDVFPDTCPFCEKGVVFIRRDAYSNGYEEDLQVIFRCPRNECKKYSVGMYRFSETVYVGRPDDPEEKPLFVLHEVLPKTPVKSRTFERDL